MALRVVTLVMLLALSLSDVTSGRVCRAEQDGKPVSFDPRQSARNIGNFGSCSIPEIVFGAGFDHRKETSFQPADQSEPC